MAKLGNKLKKEGLPKEVKNGKSYSFTRYNLIKIFWNYYNNSNSEVWGLLLKALEEYPLLDDIFIAIATLREVWC